LEGTDKAKYRLRGGTNQSIEVGQTGVSNSNSTITSRGAIRREHESISDSRVHPGLLSGTGPLGAGLARGRRLLPELCRKPPRKSAVALRTFHENVSETTRTLLDNAHCIGVAPRRDRGQRGTDAKGFLSCRQNRDVVWTNPAA